MDDYICIVGGKPLKGTISVQGSKNAALPMMAASLLHRGVSVLKTCPRIADVFCMEKILQALGAATWWEDHDLYMDCTNADKEEIPEMYTGRMRSSVILLGAMLARNGKGKLGYPGGCVIGSRPIDLHFYALRQLGAVIQKDQVIQGTAPSGLWGNQILFPKRSVGATQQAILAAVLAKGNTIIKNSAREPEILWFCRYLKTMGAQIKGEGTDCIFIEGKDELGAGCMKIPPDRIVAGTYICAAAATRSEITLENVPEGELDAFLDVYCKMGGQYKGNSGKLLVNGKNVQSPVKLLETGVYPGFPTDLQSPIMAVLSTIEGESCIREMVFEDRYKAADQLRKMGARIRVQGNEAVICGVKTLHGAAVQAQDLRGGASLILAALGAKGVTVLEGYSFVQRGYEHICQDLNALGAAVKRIQE